MGAGSLGYAHSVIPFDPKKWEREESEWDRIPYHVLFVYLNHNNMQTNLTQIQFCNLLRFALIIKQNVVDSSPAYLLEKYTKIIGDPKLISKEESKGVIHALLENTVKVYLDYWKPEFIL